MCHWTKIKESVGLFLLGSFRVEAISSLFQFLEAARTLMAPSHLQNQQGCLSFFFF